MFRARSSRGWAAARSPCARRAMARLVRGAPGTELVVPWAVSAMLRARSSRGLACAVRPGAGRVRPGVVGGFGDADGAFEQGLGVGRIALCEQGQPEAG